MNLTWTSAEEEQISQLLGEEGVCSKCCHRFMGFRHSAVYLRLHRLETAKDNGIGVNELKESVENEEKSSQSATNNTSDTGNDTGKQLTSDVSSDDCAPNAKQPRLTACPVCLGILQDRFMMPRMTEIAAKINDCGYDADKFTLTISLPISLTIREHSLWLHLEHSVPDLIKRRGIELKDVVPIKQVWKFIYPEFIASQVGMTHENGEKADFFVELVMLWDGDEEEMQVMQKLCPKEYKERAKKVNVYNMGVYSRQGVEKSIADVTYAQMCAHAPVPPIAAEHPFQLDFRMSRNSFYVGGRYCKYTRYLPQTPWLIKGVRKCETSLEEIIGDPLRLYLKADQVKFLASGREDVDVRMLGTGRPFAFECVNSKKMKLSADDLKELEQLINSSHPAVQVNSMAVVTKPLIKVLKEGEDSKTKRYSALCVTKDDYDLEELKKLNEIKDMTIYQDTPIRVLHRRSNATRKKTIHSMAVQPIDPRKFRLDVVSSAGSYIKELVHGDFGRTQPNLITLLGLETDILALDVEEVRLEWPRNQIVTSRDQANGQDKSTVMKNGGAAA